MACSYLGRKHFNALPWIPFDSLNLSSIVTGAFTA